MNSQQSKKGQIWKAVYHMDCIGGIAKGGIPSDIVHIHPEEFEHLSAAEDYLRQNPIPEERNGDYIAPVNEEERSLLLSAVQVRGPKRCCMQPRLETV
jgi:hypothetical protein